MKNKIIYFFPLVLILLLIIFLPPLKTRVLGISTNTENKSVRGIVLPHHNLASNVIEESLARLGKDNQYSYIVVFSPNHFCSYCYTFTTADSVKNYNIAKEIVNRVVGFDSNIKIDRDLVENEHGITLPVLQLAKYFPQAKFVPIVISHSFNQTSLENMAKFLSDTLPADTLFVASSDFAHNQMLNQAMQGNKESIEAIANYDLDKIYNFQDDHVDSPASIAILMMIMQKFGATVWETWISTHGAILTDNPTLLGTSYVIGVFR
jgi:AmmeMemoRadiSam system protein B